MKLEGDFFLRVRLELTCRGVIFQGLQVLVEMIIHEIRMFISVENSLHLLMKMKAVFLS
ncbi:hypothetical protein SAMN05444672_103169 [Bacillus sp. OK838]|nr:hypothetical protein SAMN05444672_103169 [Bacillus sp. OK838]